MFLRSRVVTSPNVYWMEKEMISFKANLILTNTPQFCFPIRYILHKMHLKIQESTFFSYSKPPTRKAGPIFNPIVNSQLLTFIAFFFFFFYFQSHEIKREEVKTTPVLSCLSFFYLELQCDQRSQVSSSAVIHSYMCQHSACWIFTGFP